MSLNCVQLKENGLNMQLCDLKFSCCFVFFGKNNNQKTKTHNHALIDTLQMMAVLAGPRKPTWHMVGCVALVV